MERCISLLYRNMRQASEEYSFIYECDEPGIIDIINAQVADLYYIFYSNFAEFTPNLPPTKHMTLFVFNKNLDFAGFPTNPTEFISEIRKRYLDKLCPKYATFTTTEKCMVKSRELLRIAHDIPRESEDLCKLANLPKELIVALGLPTHFPHNTNGIIQLQGQFRKYMLTHEVGKYVFLEFAVGPDSKELLTSRHYIVSGSEYGINLIFYMEVELKDVPEIKCRVHLSDDENILINRHSVIRCPLDVLLSRVYGFNHLEYITPYEAQNRANCREDKKDKKDESKKHPLLRGRMFDDFDEEEVEFRGLHDHFANLLSH
jgi:hypothetical protein